MNRFPKYSSHKMVICDECKGIGWICWEKLEWITTGGEWIKYWRKCPICKGTGEKLYQISPNQLIQFCELHKRLFAF